MPTPPSAAHSEQLQLRLLASRAAGEKSLRKIHELLCSPKPDALALIWRRCHVGHRALWLTFARLDSELSSLLWEQLTPGDRRHLKLVLTLMTEFYIGAGLSRRRPL